MRFVVPDRPGFGRSDPQPGRQVTDWPGDVGHLLDALGVDEFAVLSLSGGAAHALALLRPLSAPLMLRPAATRAACRPGSAPPTGG